MHSKHANEAGPRRFNSRVPIFVLAASFLVLGLGGVLALRLGHHSPRELSARQEPPAESWPETPWKNARLGVKYVGDAACTRCHGDIADTFRHHPMGRSLAPIASNPGGGGDRSDGSTTFVSGSSQFAIERRGGKEVHRETQLDVDGRVLAQVEREVKYALGSGTRGVSYLVEHEGRLFQSPISWFSRKKKWDVSPGYEQTNAHFDRPIEPYCLFCHSNRVEPVKLSVNQYTMPLFQGDSIGCERCHGPGELHARRQEMVDGRDLTIVNPRHLSPSLRSAVCEQCHLLGDQRIDRLGRDPFDYRPGLPSISFYAIYGRANQGKDKAVGHVEQMKASTCFRESQGRLGCTSCHDPHKAPSPQERVAYFRDQCLACHGRNGCKLPSPARLAQSPDNSCIQCHMPTSEHTDIVHASATDHRIIRTPRAPINEPDRAVPGLPLVLLNGEDINPKELASLGRELAMALASERLPSTDTPEVRRMGTLILSLLDAALAKRPDDLIAQRTKAQTLATSGRRADARRLTESVLRAAPSYEKALEECLVYAIAEGDNPAALAHGSRAVATNPWSAVLHERLAYAHLQSQNWDGALHEAREALRLNPFLLFARMFVVQYFLNQKDLKRAQDEVATLIELNPSRRESLGQWFTEQRRIYKL